MLKIPNNTNKYQQHFVLSSDISTRDRDGIHKTFSGLMKILYPHDEYTKEEIQEVLTFAIEGRKRVKDQLMRIDSTYNDVSFHFTDASGKDIQSTTLEETEYPSFYWLTKDGIDADAPLTESNATTSVVEDTGPKPGHKVIYENQKGISYDALFGEYIKDATKITLTDPYIRKFHQRRNLMEFLETILKYKEEGQDVEVHMITNKADGYEHFQQDEDFQRIMKTVSPCGISLTWAYDTTGTIHARHIVTNNDWKISLDRGLDIFQMYSMNDSLSLANRLQQFRSCKAFEITYLKTDHQ